MLAEEATAVQALATAGELIECSLFTAMRFHADAMEVERIQTSMPDAYPLKGRKRKRDTEWGRKVLLEGCINRGHGTAHIRWAFDDYETILSLGISAVLNVPVFEGEQVIGTINFLRGEEPFSLQEVGVGRCLAAVLGARGDFGARS